jgi:hypothetical protein
MKKFLILLVVTFLLFGSFSTFVLAEKEITVGVLKTLPNNMS